ncbi:MAG: penicillin-binding protein 2 [candidate division Zixibacteria bacterium]|nr:penicillin-binding protein 2 [candidate division Zixibacteria bacterium]
MESSKVSLAVREQFGLVVIGAIFLLLTIGLIKLQVIDHDELAEKSENNRIRVVPIIPQRGLIIDREGRVMAGNRPSYTLSVIPAEEEKGQTVPNLAKLINSDTSKVRARIRRNTVSYYQPAPVKRDLAFEAVAVLEEQSGKFPGVSYQMDRVRQYIPGASVESFAGYVDEVSEEELKKVDPDLYRMGTMIGKRGIEREYDQALRGNEGTAFIEIKASGQLLGTYSGREKVNSRPGADLTLSIDLDLQRACVEVLTQFCCGAIVAIDPRSGEVLALASYPSYDANIFSSVVPDSLWRSMQADSSHPLLNRPMTGLYPPGSTTKLITVGAGIDAGFITPSTTFRGCSGGMQFGNRYFRCWEERGHGVLLPANAIEHSCDVYMYQLGMKIGPQILAEYFQKCGFGVPTGVDLPGEASGNVPTIDYYNKRYGEKKWTRTLVLNTSIGQGEILVTPFQLTQFFCGVANNGTVYRPHVVKQITDPTTGKTETVKPEISFKLPFTPTTLGLLKESIRLVVEGSGGTARGLKNKYYSIGGKTGTAQNPHGNEHSLFVGVAPLEAPEIVVCAIVENAGHGSEIAAPAAAKIIQKYMYKKLGIVDTLQLSLRDSL